MNAEADANDPGFLWYKFFDTVFFFTLIFLFGQRWFKDCISMREAVAVFDVRNATLTTESDRLLLLRFINHEWGQDESMEKGLDDFNHHIRNDVQRSLPMRGPRSWVLVDQKFKLHFSIKVVITVFR